MRFARGALPGFNLLSVLCTFAVLAVAGPGRAEPPADGRVILVSYGDHFVVFEGDAKLDEPEP